MLSKFPEETKEMERQFGTNEAAEIQKRRPTEQQAAEEGEKGKGEGQTEDRETNRRRTRRLGRGEEERERGS